MKSEPDGSCCFLLFGQNIPYDTLMEELDVSTVRDVEDILIDTIYSVRDTLFVFGCRELVSFQVVTVLCLFVCLLLPGGRCQGLIQGKLDQKLRCFVVKYAVGRDTHDEGVDEMIEKLISWKKQSANMYGKIGTILRYALLSANVCSRTLPNALLLAGPAWRRNKSKKKRPTKRVCAPRWKLAQVSVARALHLVVRTFVKATISVITQTLQVDEGTLFTISCSMYTCILLRHEPTNDVVCCQRTIQVASTHDGSQRPNVIRASVLPLLRDV